jgi:hypothetical protein
MEAKKVKKAYRKPSWRRQEALEHFAMQGLCKAHPSGTACCQNARS